MFLAKDVAEWIENKDTTSMLRNVDEDEKTLRLVSGDLRPRNFLTENGLYEVLMQNQLQSVNNPYANGYSTNRLPSKVLAAKIPKIVNVSMEKGTISKGNRVSIYLQ
ncbi:BRO family protein [Weizmannia sp. CD-2023]|nr:BRO family protein [Weizmannia sp. CD-2023]